MDNKNCANFKPDQCIDSEIFGIEKIGVVGLGYVGLPVAVAFAQKGCEVVGYDVSISRVQELRCGEDHTNSVSLEALANLSISENPQVLKDCDNIIVCVPTPIDEHKKPDLQCLLDASRDVGQNMKQNTLVVYESTVAPWTTRKRCLPILEAESGMRCPEEFKIGYSPERINPGDKEHTIETITKVVSGYDQSVLNQVAILYEHIAPKVHRAPSIEAAEGGKIIENTQRDVNIGLINELTGIFHSLDIPFKDVLEAAGTKWNFLNFKPGFVGGHCIGVDPFYLANAAQQAGFHPELVLAGRRVNDGMPEYVAQLFLEAMNEAGKVPRLSSAAIFGLTYKSNVPDLRESGAMRLGYILQEYGVNTIAVEPLVKEVEFKNVDITQVQADAIFYVNNHNEFKDLSIASIKEKLHDPGILIDITGRFTKQEAEKEGIIYRGL